MITRSNRVAFYHCYEICNNFFLRIISVLWRHLIVKHGGQLSSVLDVSSLAKITDGYTPGHMTTACKQVHKLICMPYFKHLLLGANETSDQVVT